MFLKKIFNALDVTLQLRYKRCEKEKRLLQEEIEKLKRENLELRAKKDDLVSTGVFSSRIGDALNKEGEKLKHNGRH